MKNKYIYIMKNKYIYIIYKNIAHLEIHASTYTHVHIHHTRAHYTYIHTCCVYMYSYGLSVEFTDSEENLLDFRWIIVGEIQVKSSRCSLGASFTRSSELLISTRFPKIVRKSTQAVLEFLFKIICARVLAIFTLYRTCGSCYSLVQLRLIIFT